MAVTSAGLILYRRTDGGELEILLGHMGGPFWAKKDAGAWSIPKGEYGPEEDAFVVARREFEEELGSPAPVGDYREMGTVVQSGGKRVTAWAIEADFAAESAVSNTFELEWPPKSGRLHTFPEIDRACWFALDEAMVKVVKGQRELIIRLAAGFRAN